MNLLLQHDKYQFVDQNDQLIPHQRLERQEQTDALIFIPKDATVLELGARYGTVSCLINKILTDPKKHVAIEPDETVLNALLKNRQTTGCHFEVFRGVVSRTPVNFVQNGYSSLTPSSGTDSTGVSNKTQVPMATLEEVEQYYNLKFDVLVADCEGCIEPFVRENNMKRFRLILLEKDQGGICNYTWVHDELTLQGFIMVKNEFNEVYRSVYVNTNLLPFTVDTFKVGYGSLAFFHKLGYLTDAQEELPLGISAHAPSTLKLDLKIPLEFRGGFSPSALKPAVCVFIIDGKFIDLFNKKEQITDSIRLEPGKHILEIKCIDNTYAHTMWFYS